MATQSELVMRTGPNPGQSYALTKPDMLVGRDIGNDIVINDAEVSRKHARLIAQGERYVIEDLGSTNGTFINGQRIAGPHLLSSGEIVQMGENVTLLYSATVFDPDATAVMAAREAARLDETPPPMPSPIEMSEPEPMAAPEPPPYGQTMADQLEDAPAPAFEMPPAPAYEMPPPPAYRMPEPTPAPMEMPPMPSSAFTGPSMSEPAMAAPPKKKSNRTAIIAGCGCLAIVICGGIGGLLYYIDANNLWCTWLSIC